MKEDIKELIKGIGILLAFFFTGTIVVLCLYMAGIEIDTSDYKTLVIFDFIISSIIAILAVLLYKNLFKEHYLALKDKQSELRKEYIEVLIISFIMFMVWKIIGSTVTDALFGLLGVEEVISDNQNLIEQLQASAPILMAFSITFLAPISEELIFRGMLGKVIKNKKVFIPVSGIIFGLMHVTGSVFLMFEILLIGLVITKIISQEDKEQKQKISLSVISVVLILIIGGIYFYIQNGNIITQIMNIDIAELLNGINYIVMGLYLAYLYAKYDNIYLPIGVHALNNGIAAIMMLFML